MFNNTFPTIVT